MKTFKPLKADNEKVELRKIPLPVIASYKMDGIRCLFYKGNMYTSSLKSFQNKNVLARFEHLRKLSEDRNILIDGELMAKSMEFNDLSGMIRSFSGEVPDDLYFYAFDMVINDDFEEPFEQRIKHLDRMEEHKYLKVLPQIVCNTYEEIEALYEKAIAFGNCDGLMLRNPVGRYKLGRATNKQNIIFKLKPYITEDSKIIGVIQATEVREGAEKKINELGRSVTSKLKSDRVLIEKASAFVVLYNEQQLKVTIAMTDTEKEEIWQNKEKYIGKWIEYKGMKVGAKENGLLRHPTTIRFRTDKD
jgi:DNA ligase-1